MPNFHLECQSPLHHVHSYGPWVGLLVRRFSGTFTDSWFTGIPRILFFYIWKSHLEYVSKYLHTYIIYTCLRHWVICRKLFRENPYLKSKFQNFYKDQHGKWQKSYPFLYFDANYNYNLLPMSRIHNSKKIQMWWNQQLRGQFRWRGLSQHRYLSYARQHKPRLLTKNCLFGPLITT